MQRATVASGAIVSVGYEAATSILEVELSSGEVVQFYNVPLTVYIALAKAAAKGDYYHHNIKPVYESKPVTEDIIQPNNEVPHPINN